MNHVFTWDVRGTTQSGRPIIYKQYSKISMFTKADALSAAERDVNITRELLVAHENAIVVIDVVGVRMSRKLIAFVRRCVDVGMPRAEHIHVVNCPQWASIVYKMVESMLGPENSALAVLHRGTYDSVQDLIEAI